MPDRLPDWLGRVREYLPGWIDRVTHDASRGQFRQAVEAREPYDIHTSNLMRTVIYTVRDDANLPNSAQRSGWVEYLLSHQRPEDGLMVDPAVERHIVMSGDAPPERQVFNIRHMLTRNVLGTVCFLGGKPRYRLSHEECFGTPAEIVARLERLNWRNPWGAGSWAGAAVLFQHYNRLLGDDRAEALVRAAVDWLARRQDPATGAWSDGSPGISLHRLINGIFKVWIQLLPVTDLPVQYPERVIDLCVRGLHEDPVLGRNPDACSIFDVAFVLDVALRFSDHRRQEVAELARAHLPLLEPMARPDGGFSYGPDPLVRHSNLDLSPQKDQSDAFGTALVCQAAALLANLAGLRGELGWTPPTERRMSLPSMRGG
jgi:hypothetical protein